ncbi:uncharacterized protein LOC125500990 [Athalia rosae]|uniref:uncharacterized protein LOC125500990 n=1 Tax=Athalia rosae TaxID=37344 RepID=UPI0020343242|nr:uncharacterized protein LOC125500990 [Athalia rosae]
MDVKDSLGEFYFDDLSECLDCRLTSSTDDGSDSSNIAIRKRRSLPLIYSDSEDKDMNNNVEDNNESIMDIVNLFIGSDLIKHFVRESNRYHYEIVEKDKITSKTKKMERDVTVTEMKKFSGLIIFMGQVKDVLYDYWSTDPSIETPFFSKVMSRNRLLQIMQSWHFCHNNDIPPNSQRLTKMQPVIEYSKEKFNNVYKPDQQLSLDECSNPWRSRLTNKTYNPAKITRYGKLFGCCLKLVWNNGKRNVNMMSTIDSAQRAESRNRSRTSDCLIQKPISIMDYNEYMKGVGRADQ